MDDTHDVDGLPDNPENDAVFAFNQVTVGSPPGSVFWYRRTSLRETFECLDMFFEPPDETRRVLDIVGGDVRPNLIDIGLC